ncbi:DnaJ domain-containing protein [Candidatus Dependentiae bacterium]|nr:DnaJ domain-containing protein [Candidatus Dependentiae bacterium]
MQEKSYYGSEFTFSANKFAKAPLKEKQALITIAKLVLGYSANDKPSSTEIKKRYHKLSLAYHPDKKKGLSDSLMISTFAQEIFKIINEAYEILKEAHKENLL